jgi:hypothetical protein
MKLWDFINEDELNAQIEAKMVKATPHPSGKLLIYNYTQMASFTPELWNHVTDKCRGLIVDIESGDVVARPFSKFWNYADQRHQETMPENLPSEPPNLTRKMDGCFLGNAKLNLWGGGSITIREVVRKRLACKLVGMNDAGEMVPCEVVDWYDNGTKTEWLNITVDCLPFKLSGCRTGNRLTVTPNHHVHVNGKFIPALNVVAGDVLSTYEDSPGDEVMHLMRSSLLGDGCISPVHGAFRFADAHKVGHKEYASAIEQWLGDCGVASRSITSGHGTEMVQVVSKAYKSLGELRNEWYPHGIKVIPEDLSWMDDFSIAKWYMDDGSLSHSDFQKDRALFATNGFTEVDVDRLAQKLRGMYGVDAVPFFSKGWSIRVNAGDGKAIDEMWERISPYFIECMRYKLPVKWRTDTNRSTYPRGLESRRRADAKVLRVESVERSSNLFNAGRTGFDLKTTTENYMVKGVLVHNSLGILYWLDGLPAIATRGSFTSEQAIWATKWIREHATNNWPDGFTPLFEIVFPENQIVVRYDYSGLVLLAMVQGETGEEMEYWGLSFWAEENRVRVVDKFDKPLEVCVAEDVPNEEGYVASWERPGTTPLRCKIKYSGYCRLHKLLTQTNAVTVWEMLRDGLDVETLTEDVPNEFRAWIDGVEKRLRDEFKAIEDAALAAMLAYPGDKNITDKETKKAFAIYVTSRHPKVAPIMFAMVEGKKYAPIIHKMIRPRGDEKTFKVDTEG